MTQLRLSNHQMLMAVMLCAFAVSAANIVSAAVHVGGIGAWVAYAYPIGVDIALAMVIRASAQRSELGERNRAERLIAIVLTVFSVIVNAAHSPNSPAAIVINCAPPIVILLVSYIGERDATLERKRSEAVNTLTQIGAQIESKRRELDSLTMVANELQAKRDELQAIIASLRKEKRAEEHAQMGSVELLAQANAARQAKSDERRADVLKLLQQGMKQTQIAEQLGVGIATIRRDVKALNGRAHHLVEANEGGEP